MLGSVAFMNKEQEEGKANRKAYRISDAITGIDDEKFVLPVIQRRLVWDEEKMTLLFDTILTGGDATARKRDLLFYIA